MNDCFTCVPDYFKKFDNEYDCGNGAFMRIYYDTDIDSFKSYLIEIEKKGFSLYSKNEIEKNFYYTYTGNGITLHTYYVEVEKTVRVVADPFSALFKNAPEKCEEKCDTVVYQFETDHSLIDCGMCFIIRCCDGSFFIIDSAHFYQTHDNQRIFDFLKSISIDGKIVINGWFFSHQHDDHVCKFMDFLRSNMTDDVTIKALYYNFVNLDYPFFDGMSETDRAVCVEFNNLVAKHTELPKIKLHSGQKFYCKNLEFQVLCTHEDVYPDTLEDFNNTSTVLMLNAYGNKIFIPGDASNFESKIMTTRFTSKTLKSDILQVAHHGHFGCSSEFYRMVDAPTILYPTTLIKHDEEYDHFEANRVAHELCKECFISSNGTVGLKLPYTVGNAIKFNDATFENFGRIKQLWGYEYTEEFKEKLRKEFIKNGGVFEV